MPPKKKVIKEKTNKRQNYTNSFHLFTFRIMNRDCNERCPQQYMIAIVYTIYKDHYKTLQLVILTNQQIARL